MRSRSRRWGARTPAGPPACPRSRSEREARMLLNSLRSRVRLGGAQLPQHRIDERQERALTRNPDLHQQGRILGRNHERRAAEEQLADVKPLGGRRMDAEYRLPGLADLRAHGLYRSQRKLTVPRTASDRQLQREPPAG